METGTFRVMVRGIGKGHKIIPLTDKIVEGDQSFMVGCENCGDSFLAVITKTTTMGLNVIAEAICLIPNPCPNSHNLIKEKELTMV